MQQPNTQFTITSLVHDQIFAVRQIVKKTIDKDRAMYMAFVDLEMAYDNVHRKKLEKVLEECGVKGRL